ncbi:MAG: ATP-binding protein, partial [Proteobacteria bacterium]|nr:ATP-binding protein [Pseudomonadota bacterium]
LGGHDLARLARRIHPRFGWNDLVMTPPMETQLREICDRVLHRDTVLGQWRFADKLALGRGVTALFAGPSGTGKTMAAEVVAGVLGIDLFKIDLASVVSKYIGETEQNLDRIFRAAEDVNGILLFDEADALFGKRSEVQDARDRYANLEISYLLQKMEEFEGIAILSTNLQKNLDDAFTRRLAFIVHFPFPEAAERRRIWDVSWPAALPRAPGLQFDALARAFKLSGGNIKSAALGAAFLAAAEDAPVSMRHVVRAIEREYEKLGRPLKQDEVAPFLSDTAMAAPA